MSTLPPEILHEILSICLQSSKSISSLNLMTVSSLFCNLCQQLLYSQLYFTTRAQLALFISIYGTSKCTVPYVPRSLEFDITAAGIEAPLIFSDIHTLFSQCLSELKDAERDENDRLCLDSLRLRLNSHYSDPRIEMIYTALSLVNPRRFIWTGPDPAHHFSIAIVPRAITPLFRALSSYTNLTYLKLTHLSMAFRTGVNQFPIIPSLHTFHLGQVVFLNPSSIAALIFDPNSVNLQKLYLVDAYLESIWGSRFRRSDVERAARTLRSAIVGDESLGQELDEDVVDRIRCTIICEAQTERITGGDRVEDNKVLV